MIDAIESWLTYVNVSLLGLKPFHFNLVKTPLLLLGVGILLWTAFAKSSSHRIDGFLQRGSRIPYRRLTFFLSTLLCVSLAYLSLKQFYAYTAEAYDLGIYSNSLWHTAQGEWFFDSLKNEHLLGDHFGPILIAFVPLYYLWESPVWLLLIQAVALTAGGIAVGFLTYRLTMSSLSALVMLLLYGSNPYLHSVAALDFHPIALAIPVFLWMLYCFDTDRYWTALSLSGVALLVEESLPPGLVGVGIYLFAFIPRYRWTGVGLALVGTVWFLVEVTVLLPHFSQHALIHWDRYDNLGPNFRAALYNLATNPMMIVTEAFIRDHKIYYVAALLLSVGFLPLFAWRQATLVVLPALMMLLSHNGGHYKFGFHYSAAVLPFLFYSAAYGLASVRDNLPTRMPALARSNRAVFTAFLVFLIINVYQIRGYRLSHVDPVHVEMVETVLQYLPNDASVRAEGNLLAMLSSRHQIAAVADRVEENFVWWVPDYFVMDFRYVAHNETQLAARRKLVELLTEGDQYRLVIERDGVMLFKIARQQRADRSCADGPIS